MATATLCFASTGRGKAQSRLAKTGGGIALKRKAKVKRRTEQLRGEKKTKK